MPSSQRDLVWFQIQRAQFAKVLRPQAGKLMQQLPERLALALARLCPAVEWLKRPGLAELDTLLARGIQLVRSP